MKFSVTKTSSSKLTDINFETLKFGDTFADHMFEVRYKNGAWGDGAILPYGPIKLDPAFSVLHYGQAVFEGMKAFRYKGNKVNIFRLDMHYKRFIRSCDRMNIAHVPQEMFVESIKQLVDVDRDWVPADKYKSLYLRPFIFASDEFLGVRVAMNYRYMVITGPVGNYYSEGIKPTKLTTYPQYVRAVKGGTGEAKVPGNYAATMQPNALAAKEGYAQVLWLDAFEHKYIEEVGTSNIFFKIGDELITPPLEGTILPGITRDSVIWLAKKWGMHVVERKISIDEVFEASKAGDLQEIFATGTAAVISPVGYIHHDGKAIDLKQDKMGELSQKLYDTLTGIHHGDVEDPDDWCTLI
ncbi:MAG: branched-chain amino acid aminotransferase [Balneolales bacterium]|nr:branched-chain amino acid aminotransferase [Balneolales bacterium]